MGTKKHAAVCGFLLALVFGILRGSEARADSCCGCANAAVAVSNGNPAPNEPVTISFTASWCNCQPGPPGNCHNGSPQPCGAMGSPVTIFVELNGGGAVATHTCGAFTGTNDSQGVRPIPNSTFEFSTDVLGEYVAYAVHSGPCGTTAPVFFTVGCGTACADIGSPRACESCSGPLGTTPQISADKDVIRTLCPSDCDVEEGQKGETVTVSIAGGAADCYSLELDLEGAVEAVSPPPTSGSWSGSLSVQLRGLIGVGHASVSVRLFQFDAANLCWSESETRSISLDARPDDDCTCPSCPVGGGSPLGDGGAVRSAPVLAGVRLRDVEINIRAGATNILRIPQIVRVTPNGDPEVLLPDRANSVIFRPGDGFLDGWVLGGPRELVQLSHIPSALTYVFESTSAGPYPFRLQRIKRFDQTAHSYYSYDALGRLARIYAGANSSPDYFALAYLPDGKLLSITPHVGGVADPDRAIQLIYAGNTVIGADGAACPSCGAQRRRYYFDARGLLTRVTDAEGTDVELYAYDAEGRVTELRRLDDTNAMVIVKTVAYVGGPLMNTTQTVRERVSETQERIRVETFDAHGRLVQTVAYPALFAIGAPPSGPSLTTNYNRTSVEDPTGIRTETEETIDPAGVAAVNVVRTFPSRYPIYLPAAAADGWALPLAASDGLFDLQGFHPGGTVLVPAIVGAAATCQIEVAASGLHHPQALLRAAANALPGSGICVRVGLAGGGGSFGDAYFRRQQSDAGVPEWTRGYTSCANFGQPGSLHAGWQLSAGTVYTLTLSVVELTPAANPLDGWGIDGLGLARSDSTPGSSLPLAEYDRPADRSRYVRNYKRGTDGSIAEDQIQLQELNAVTAGYQTLYAIDARGGVTNYRYTDSGLVSEITLPRVTLLDGGGTYRARAVMEYDANNRLVREGRTNSGGGLTYTETQYDAFGQVTAVIRNAAGPVGERATTTHAYNIYGDRISTTDPCGNVTERFFGTGGMLTDEVAYESGGAGAVLSQLHVDYNAEMRPARKRFALANGGFPIGAPPAWADTVYTYDRFGRLLSQADPGPLQPLVTTIDYDFQGRVIATAFADGTVSRRTYDGLSRIVNESLEGPGHSPLQTFHVFNSLGQRARTEAPGTGTVLFEYDALGRLRARVDAARTVYSHDSSSLITRELVLDPGETIAYSDTVMGYDELGRQIRQRERLQPGTDGPSDPLTITVYDAGGMTRARVQKADGNANDQAREVGDAFTLNSFDGLGRRVGRINGVGETTAFEFDACGRLTRQVVDPNGLALATSYQNDALGRRTREVDSGGYPVATEYNSHGDVVRVTHFNPSGQALHRLIMEYAGGRQLYRKATLLDPSRSAIDSNVDDVETLEYDAAGKKIGAGKMVGGVLRSVQIEYDGLARRSVVRWPEQPSVNYIELHYDATSGLMSSRVEHNSLGLIEVLESHDEFGRNWASRVRGTGGTERLTVREFDPMGRIVSVVAPDGIMERQTYDLAGRRVDNVADDGGLARLTRFGYDRFGHNSSVTAFDSDGPEQVTSYVFDAAGRPVQMIAADGGVRALTYDPAGRQASIADPRGFEMVYTYDARSLRTGRAINHPDFLLSESFEYDGMRRLAVARRDSNNHVAFSYDALGRQIQQVQTVQSDSKTISFGRDQNGQRTSMIVTDLPAITYEYDNLGLTRGIRRDGQPVVQYEYSGRRPLRRSVQLSGESLGTEWSYDNVQRISGIRNRAEGANRLLFGFDYSLDLGGSPVREVRSGLDAASQTDFSYDGLRRIVSADYDGSVPGREEFSYDVLSNRIQSRGRLADFGEPTRSYTSGAANQYSQINGSALAYDAAGNLIRDERGYQFSYDYANRITAIRNPAGQVAASYRYDALGRRTETIIDNATTRYYYDDEENVLSEYDAVGQRLRYYIHGRTNVDERAILHDDDVSHGGAAAADYAYALKNLYSIAGLVNASGQVVEDYQYDGFGNVLINARQTGDIDGDGDVDIRDFPSLQLCYSQSPSGADCRTADVHADGQIDFADFVLFADCTRGPDQSNNDLSCLGIRARSAINSYFFTGRHLDVIDGGALRIQHNRHRYYSPQDGRWYSRDPLGIQDSANLYEYARTRPTRMSDPSGLVTINTPWLSVEVGDGCGSLSHSFDGPSDDRYFLGGKIKFYYELGMEVKGEVCKKCCKAGKSAPNMVGQEVYDGSFELSGEVTGGVDFRPWGVYQEFGWPLNIGVDAWAGIRIGASLTGQGSGTLGSDRCNNRLLTGNVCFEGSLTGTLSGGAEITVTDLEPEEGEDETLFEAAATINGSLTIALRKCYKCISDSCAWEPARVCIRGEAWIEATFMDYGIEIPLMEDYDSCDDD